MNNTLSKILKISENYFYIYPIFSNKTVMRYNFGPLGELLRNNISNEWLLANVTSRDGNVFPFHFIDHGNSFINEIKIPYSESKKISRGHLPFSIVFPRIPVEQDVEINASEESKYFRPKHISLLKSVTFTSPDDGRRYFHYWLRQRKMWWRKFSANPGRFSVTEIKNDSEHIESANIQASFPWGIMEIETVKSYTGNIFESLEVADQTLWKLKSGKKNIFPCVIESITNLEISSMCYLCDSFIEDVRLDTKMEYQLMKLHRKLAPYKIAIVLECSKNELNEDLIYLGEFLVLNLKKAGISSLFLLEQTSISLEDQYKYYDLLGVPYLVVLHESTLTDGLFGLRCKETTLHEQLHISKLTEYVEKLMMNY